MAFYARMTRVFATASFRRGVTFQPGRLAFVYRSPWGHDRIPKLSGYVQGRRSYHGGGGSGNGGTSWDGLVYSIIANIRGEYDYGAECFYSAALDDDDSFSPSTPSHRRDIRLLLPLNLDRTFLALTSRDIALRLKYLCAHEAHTPDYAAILSLTELLARLGALETDNPLLTLEEYKEIWLVVKAGLKAAGEMELQVISIWEEDELRGLQWNAEGVWGTAVLNAAVRKLSGEKVEGDEEGGAVRRTTFRGDLRSLAYKICGLLLDNKDIFPKGEKWFGEEQEVCIMEAVVRVLKEAGRRGDF
ncbi:hypothetical protein P280DRAFT_467712 [Massarina eburnea CBS 473.64]|uniref:Uncharacterized protein n=1 Tax=Massarina eburnea CBS 473.64 TaxID=1395130 RepID=A0A6A6S376_9PLEO|nr:hypothetical protein P280DRAFT_467712 [Massarina eburnea CBS 473.64]